MICLTTTASSVNGACAQVAAARAHIDAAEIRVDLLDPDEQIGIETIIRRIRDQRGPITLIATLRLPADGGSFRGSSERRRDLLARAIGSGVDYVDLELERRGAPDDRELCRLAAVGGVRVIRSVHATDGVPPQPAALIRELSSGGREVAKLAAMPRGVVDLCALLRAADETAGVEKILIGMGEYGLPTRILAHRFGSLLTFGAPDGRAAAPGQLPVAMLDLLYRQRSVGERTRCFAVIGDPVAHSKSPDYHNRRFAADALDAVYLPVRVDDVGACFDFAREIPLSGFSVTIPHKEAVIPHLAGVDDAVRATGACNTVVAADGGSFVGTNTDVSGFLRPLVPGARTALVLGAGGAARGVCYALLSRGVHVRLWNRTPDRARALAAYLAAIPGLPGSLEVAPDEEAARLCRADLVVNTTSVGMHGEGDPAPWYEFDAGQVACDIVYTPAETPFIRRARRCGSRVVTGDRMFEAQAALQYELYREAATRVGA